MSKNALHRDDAPGVLLACAINHSHPAASDFLQDFVVPETPLRVGHVRFYEDAFEGFARGLAFGFESLAQETVDARRVINLRYRAALRAFRRIPDYVRNRIRWRGCFIHQAAAASAAHKCRISSSTSAGFSTVCATSSRRSHR